MSTFYLDTAEENRIPELALHGESSGQWNGMPVPLVTFEEFRRFISAWAVNDPNGSWNPGGVSDHFGSLVYDDGENEPEFFQGVRSENGQTLYAITGWNLEVAR